MQTLRWPAMVAGVWVAALIGIGAGASTASARPVTATDCGPGTVAYPPPICPPVTYGSSEFYPGGTVSFTIGGFKANEGVTIILHSRAVTVGDDQADASGVLHASFTIPQDFPTGAHTLILQGADGTVLSESFSVTTAPGTTATGVSATGTSTSSSSSSGALPFTGLDVVALAGGGFALLAGGGGLRVVARRRR